MSSNLNKKLDVVEACVDVIIKTAIELKDKCLKTREALAGVSTSAVRKGRLKKIDVGIVSAVTKRRSKILNQINLKP